MAATEVIDDLMADGSVTVAGATREFGLGRTRLYEWMSRGELPYSQVGAKRLIPRVALRRLIAAGFIVVNVEKK
jgi:excisionase family DNA binding protein